MDKAFEEKMRKTLLTRRAKLVKTDRDLGKDTQGLRENDVVDLVDQGQREAASDVIMTLDDQERHEVAEIDAALERAAEGKYGICTECDEPIDKKRLEALPEARTCAGCVAEPVRAVR